MRFSMDGTWEVSTENPTMDQVGSLFLVSMLKAVDFVERLTGLELPVAVRPVDCSDEPCITPS